jgi:hypothetical protein
MNNQEKLDKLQGKINTAILDLLDNFSYPINIKKGHHIEERKLKQVIYTCFERYYRIGFDQEGRERLQEYTKDFIKYLETKGINRNDNIYYGIGKVSEEEMLERFGDIVSPNPGHTFHKGRENRKKTND